MKPYLILLPIFFLAVLQGSVLPLNLVLLLVLLWVVFRPIREALVIAFLAGILLDLAKSQTLGVSSLILLGASYLLHLYSRRFNPTHPVFLAIFVFLAATVENLILQEPWLGEGLILVLLALLIRPVAKFYQESLDRTLRLRDEI